MLETLVFKGKQLDADKRNKFEQILKSVESEWSRLSRVRPSIDAFDVEKKLGSGGFGVVNMVREKLTGKVYAMKVSHLIY
jgi:serine/threonine protein kinase